MSANNDELRRLRATEDKTRPDQDANAVTTYNYNPDDSPSSLVDARGSASTFTYNSRRLVTYIAYGPSAGVPDTPDVSLEYDAAGNRKSMTDGLGSVAYVYDQLSRLTSETRNFTSIGTFPLVYGYNLANELTSVNDQTFSTTLGYDHDLAGRLSGVTGAGYPNVSQFASNMQYRAWGGLKSMSYGNGKTLAMDYNSRLLPSSYSIPGTISKTYQYYDDSRMDYSHDLGDARYDRKNNYDQVGRITVALSGAEARGLAATDERPYNQTYQYNVWGNATNHTSLQWSSDFSDSATYAENRRNGWNYDASGNWLDDGSNALQRKYDAAGRMVKIEHPAFPNNPKRTDDYDGDGQRLRSGYHTVQPEYSTPLEYTYYLRSSVLGGKIVTEIGGNGQKAMGYVYYSSGELIAVQKLATPQDVAAYIVWQHNDPADLSVRASASTSSAFGYILNRYNAELDPVGANASLEDPGPPELYQPPDENSPAFPYFGNPTNLSFGCKDRDGIPYPCPDMLGDWDSDTMANGFSMPDWAWRQLAKEPWKTQWAVYMGQVGYASTPPKGWKEVPFDPSSDDPFHAVNPNCIMNAISGNAATGLARPFGNVGPTGSIGHQRCSCSRPIGQ